jgi:hypothetical protein
MRPVFSRTVRLMKTKRSTLRRTLARRRALAVLSRIRNRGESPSKAARALHTTLKTVRKFVGPQLRRTASGRYKVTRSDRLKREIVVLSREGYQPVTVRSSRQAKLASRHLIAVTRFLRDGDTAWLKSFIGKRIDGVELLTDPDRIREFAEADLVKLDGLYRDQRGSAPAN